MQMTQQVNELAKALAGAQGEMERAIVDKVNTHFKGKYATINAVLETIRPVLAKHGLSFTQTFDTVNDMHCMTTLLMHESGQFITSQVQLCKASEIAQEVGKKMTYFRRYTLGAMVGLSSGEEIAEDDDGEAERLKAALAKQADEESKAKTKKEKIPMPELPELSEEVVNAEIANMGYKDQQEDFRAWLQMKAKDNAWNMAQVIMMSKSNKVMVDKNFATWLAKKDAK